MAISKVEIQNSGAQITSCHLTANRCPSIPHPHTPVKPQHRSSRIHTERTTLNLQHHGEHAHTKRKVVYLKPILTIVLLALIAAAPCHATPPDATPSATSPTIVIGFLGGHVKKNNAIHSEVQVAIRLLATHPANVYAEVFENSQGPTALRQIFHLLDANHDGTLTPAEKQQAQIILYGHSWGASETITIARQLQVQGIPVLLAILVDRVKKIGAGDDRIPANVAQAVNFYQLNGLLHGAPTIRAANPDTTQILGNYKFDYATNHIACEQYPWYARAFMKPHIEIENDPSVWNQVEQLIRAKLPPQPPPQP
jgi:hypothetical protein